MKGRNADVCVVLGATESFLPGAVVAIHSFLQQHPGFGGGMVLVHDGLPAARCAALARAFPPLRVEPVSAALRDRLARFPAARGVLARRRPADFHSLEAFRVGGYRKVLFFDCDVLFRRPIDALFARDDDLLCCGDRAFFNGWRRDAATYRILEDPADAGPEGALERTFNSGLLLVDGRLTGERSYRELLALLEPETWRGTETLHTDQFILNRYFAGRQTLVSGAYNYRPNLAGAIRAREGLSAEDAKVVHFTRRVKPWTAAAMLHGAPGAAPRPPHPMFAAWYGAWMDCLTSMHLRAAAAGSRGAGAGRARGEPAPGVSRSGLRVGGGGVEETSAQEGKEARSRG